MDEHPFRGPLLMRGSHAPVQARCLLDSCIDRALESAGRARSSACEMGEQLRSLLELDEESIRLAEPVMGVLKRTMSHVGMFVGGCRVWRDNAEGAAVWSW